MLPLVLRQAWNIAVAFTVVEFAMLLGLVSLVRDLPMAWPATAHAEQAHQHASPHGGQIMTAGRYHLEVVVQDHQTILVYLYDEYLKPLAVPTPEATLYLRLPGNKNHTLTLQSTESEGASVWATTTDVLREAPTFEAALRVHLDGESRNIRFAYNRVQQSR